MGMLVDNTCGKMFSGSIDHLRPTGAEVFADSGYFSVLQEDVSILKYSCLFSGPYGGIFEEDIFLFRQLPESESHVWIGDGKDLPKLGFLFVFVVFFFGCCR